MPSLLSSLSCRVAKEDECEFMHVFIIQEGADILKAEVQGGTGIYTYQWSNGVGNLSQIKVTKSGYYSVTVEDFGNKCKRSAGYQFTASASGDCGSFTSVSDADNNDVNNGPKYQTLYNWYAIQSGKLCPQGWHVPTMAEWEKLFTFLKNDSLTTISMLKQDPLWKVSNSATNESQFSALPGGRRQTDGSFVFEGIEADFWASDESQSGYTQAITLRANSAHISRIGWSRNNGFSCRCVKN